MDHPLCHLYAAEVHAGKGSQELVVISGNIDDPRALARLAQQLLHHVIAALRPVPVALQPPAVHDIANQNQRVRLMVAQEIEQKIGTRGFGAESEYLK